MGQSEHLLVPAGTVPPDRVPASHGVVDPDLQVAADLLSHRVVPRVVVTVNRPFDGPLGNTNDGIRCFPCHIPKARKAENYGKRWDGPGEIRTLV